MNSIMKSLLLLTVMLSVLLGVSLTSAQVGYPTGYETVFNAPRAGMYPLNYTCTLNFYEAVNGTWTITPLTATVDAYIVWVAPPRPADYHLRYAGPNGVNYWIIWSQETLDQLCKP